ncbi:MAG: hypothetical protein AAFY73_05430 [Pseudomonadota bacterium]
MAGRWHILAGLFALHALAACEAEPADEASVRICPAHELEGDWHSPKPGDDRGAVLRVEIEGRCNGLVSDLVAIVHTACGRTPCKWPTMPLEEDGTGLQGTIESFAAVRFARFDPAGLLLKGSFRSRFVNEARGTSSQVVTLERLED